MIEFGSTVPKDYVIKEGDSHEWCLAPRVVILSDGNMLLVRYRDTWWHGIPGGKMKEDELVQDVNYLEIASFPILSREVFEETGESIGDDLIRSSACIGITEIVEEKGGIMRLIQSPIFVCLVDRSLNEREDTKLVNLHDHIPGPLFPDARMAIERLKRGGNGPIEPEFLNPNGKLIYVNFDGNEPKVQFGL